LSERLGKTSPHLQIAGQSVSGLRRRTVARAPERAVAADVTAGSREMGAAPWIDTLYILGALAVMVGAIALLGALGFGFGFNVYPFGEDNAWIDMLRRGEGADAARLFWATDHRNPLSPWWYISTRWIILNFEPGLLALRYATSALMALSSYCLVVTIAGRRSRSFALGLAIVIVFWMANRYTDQIFWNFQGALAFSLLSIAAYAQFLRGNRRSYHLYAISLVAWFIAFTTYTIQCGAMLAIAYLALRRSQIAPTGGKPAIMRVLLTAVADTAPYVALFALFLLIWQTTIHPAAANAISLQFTWSGFLSSLREGLWTSDLRTFYWRVAQSPDLVAIVVAAAACTTIAFGALLLRRRWPETDARLIELPQLVDVFVVLACVAAPTVALESSSSVWIPGTRWPMIYQVTTPALLLAIAALFMLMLTRPGLRRYCLWSTAVAVFVGIGAAFSLAHNQWQEEITANEKFVRDGLFRLIAEDFASGRKPPLQVLIMLDEKSRGRWRSSDTLSPVIARVWLKRDDISFRLVPWYPTPADVWASWWPVQIGPDSEGVTNAKVWGGVTPYENLRILDVKGDTAQRISIADRDAFRGWEVKWQRSSPISLPQPRVPFCPVTWSADQDALLAGWSIAERDERGPFRWTTSRSARLTLPSDCRNRALLRVFAASALSTRNIDNLELDANGHKLQYRRMIADGEFVYEAELPAEIVGQKPLLDIDLAVSALDSIPNATRQFGIAIRQVEIQPADRPH
jgi:hypothetical protein